MIVQMMEETHGRSIPSENNLQPLLRLVQFSDC
jgi:hypothetical protein